MTWPRRRPRSAADIEPDAEVVEAGEEPFLRDLPADDPRLVLTLEQVLRGLTFQQGTLDNLRARAGTLVAASALVSSFFGTSVLKAPRLEVEVLVVVTLALVALTVVIVAAVVIIWPYEWKWGTDGHRLLNDYVLGDPPSSLNAMRYTLTYYIQQDLVDNEDTLGRLWTALRVAVFGIAFQVVFWSIALIL